MRILVKKGLDSLVVWDWKDVPGAQSMHFDVCILTCESQIRLEVDGSSHFWAGLHTRKDEDIMKDSILNAVSVGLLRMHFLDVELWEWYIDWVVHAKLVCVAYTHSYHLCLRGEIEYQQIVGKERLTL